MKKTNNCDPWQFKKKLRIIEIAINSNILTLNHEVVLADFNSIRAEIFKQKET